MSKSKRVIVTEVGENCPYNYLCMPTSPLLAKESDSGKRFCKETHKECCESNCPYPIFDYDIQIEPGTAYITSIQQYKQWIKSGLLKGAKNGDI